MAAANDPPLTLTEGRFARFELIEWWDQARLREARVLIIGAGALGNEVIKNLALLGVGTLVIVDMDHIEKSNLCRSVLFRESDEGRPKAQCAAEAVAQLYPEIRAVPLVGNVMADVGLGHFRRADIVVGAIDNREARVFVNAACARVGRPWIDGGIEVLRGIIRGFAPPATACYECTMNQADWELLNRRRSCSLLGRRAQQEHGTPTTPTTASIIGAMQAQEVVKLLHGMDALLGEGYLFDGAGHDSYRVSYPVNPECGWHEPAAAIEAVSHFSSDTLLADVWDFASERLDGLDAIDFGQDIVEKLACARCGQSEDLLLPVEKIPEKRVLCPSCDAERVPHFVQSLSSGSELLQRTVRQMGLPPWGILWARRNAEVLGIEMAGDQC